MRRRRSFETGMLGLSVIAISIGVWSVAQPSAQDQEYTPPRTAWGDPDLSGVWNNGTTTPWERPPELADREFLTDEEVAVRNETQIRAREQADNRATPVEMDERGPTVRTKRTSLITDPPNGRLPPLSPEGQKRMDALIAQKKWPPGRAADSWLDRMLPERCLFYRGLPPAPTNQNNNYAITQTPEYVAILQEHIHEVRVIYTDGRPHLHESIRQWHGDSRGRWDGDTLVVETTNFYGYDRYWFGIKPFAIQVSDAYHLIERFTRVLPDMIDYTFTVTDPLTFSRPFSGSLPMTKFTGVRALMFESACHEGNYGMTNILEVARYEEAQAARKR